MDSRRCAREMFLNKVPNKAIREEAKLKNSKISYRWKKTDVVQVTQITISLILVQKYRIKNLASFSQ
jgi:hypothetical protein